MKRQFIILAAVLVLGIALFLLLEGSALRSGRSAESNAAPDTAPAKTRRTSRPVRTPQEAQERLQEFLVSERPGGYRFGEVARWSAKLTDEQLHELATNLGFDQAEGAAGWLRAALFEEWARRDLHGAMGFLARGGGHDSCYQQALYGVFRGSRPDDPRAAFHHLAMLHSEFGPSTGPFSTQWSKYSLREVFGELARDDPTAAWSLLSSHELDENDAAAFETLTRAFRNPILKDRAQDTAIKGFFAGLTDENTARRYAGEFEARWNSPDTIRKLDASRKNPGLSSFNAPPQEEFIATEIAAALARFDPDAAEHWIATRGPDAGESGQNRVDGMWMEWGQRHPDDALAILRAGEREDRHETLATAAIRGDARLAPEIVREFKDAPWAAQALEATFPFNGSLSEKDYFPSADRDAYVPDHHERYQLLSDAIRAGKFPPDVTARLQKSLNRNFQHTVPAARTAAGEP